METYKINHELNQYDQIEGIEFDGLMPKFMDAIGATTGNSDKYKKMFEFHPNGSDSLEVVDIDKIMENGDGNDSGDDSGEETVIVKPEPTENTEEQQAIENEISNALTSEEGGTKAYSCFYRLGCHCGLCLEKLQR